jgi:hypothetical protein
MLPSQDFSLDSIRALRWTRWLYCFAHDVAPNTISKLLIFEAAVMLTLPWDKFDMLLVLLHNFGKTYLTSSSRHNIPAYTIATY